MLFTLGIAGLLIVLLALLTVSTLWIIFASPQPPIRLTTFFMVLIAGAVAGGWLGFAFEYQTSESFRIVGCPFPLVVFHFEDGRWVDFVVPVPLLNGVLNLIIVTLLALAPLNILFRFSRKQVAQKTNDIGPEWPLSTHLDD